MPLHHTTPLLPSNPMQAVVDAPVWLKMESAQPSASFKLRGMGLAAERAIARGAARLVSSSGGNAGYAVAWAGAQLGVPVSVVVPSTTGQRMRNLIAATGAQVVVAGDVWDEAHAAAEDLATQTGGALLHPFDHPDIWEGHASMIEEVAQAGVVPQRVVVAVGGGGLLCGVVHGLRKVGWSDVPVIAVETQGAASLHAAIQADTPVTLPAITSIARTLGAKRVCDEALALCRAHDVRSLVVSDADAVRACERFLDDHRVLVEPSCGAALAAVYDNQLKDTDTTGPILVIVCGGAAITHEQLREWRESIR